MRGPVVSQPERRVSATASISSSVIAGGWNERKLSALGARAPASAVTKRMRSATRPPRAQRPPRASRRGQARRRLGRSPAAAGRRRTRARGRSGRVSIPSSPSGTLDPLEPAGRRDEEARDGSLGQPFRQRAGDRLVERRLDREAVQVDAGRRLDELRVVAAAEARRDLDHLRAVRPDPQLRVRGAVLDPERADGLRCDLRDLALRRGRGPDMGERDAEGGRVGRDPVRGHERPEDTADREADHRHLGPVDELFDEREAVTGRLPRDRDRLGEVGGVLDERQAQLALPVRRLHDDRPRHRGQLVVGPDDPRARLGDSGLGEALALAQLVRGGDRRRRRDRVREAEALGDPRADADRPVGARRDDPVDVERVGEPLDRRLVLRREDAAAVGEPEAGRCRVAVDDGEPEPAPTRRFEQPELSGACA